MTAAPEPLRLGSLFSGYGGLERGAAAVLPVETAWVSDIDKGACKILAHRYPDVLNLGDLTKQDWSLVEPIDVLTAGFPCQPVSNAGKQLGDEDERWLWDDVLRAVRDLRPSLVLLENVRGLLTARGGRLFGRVVGSLAHIGYDAVWVGLPAADVGAAHRRYRVFIAAVPTDERHQWAGAAWNRGSRPADGDCAPVTTLLTPTARDWKNVGDPARTAARMAGRGQPLGEVVVNALFPTPAVNDMGAGKTVEAWDEWTATMKAKHGNGNGHGASLSIGAQRLLPTPTTQPTTGNGHARNLGAEAKAWGRYAAAIARWEAVTRPAPPPTEPGVKGNPRLSAAFSEWLMGLPDGWVTDVPGITRNEALKACGNGVVPQQAEAALRHLLPLIGS